MSSLARTVTEVVPSPTSLSCTRDISTSTWKLDFRIWFQTANHFENLSNKDANIIEVYKKLKCHLSSRVVNTNRAKDGGAVIGHFHSATAIAHAPQDLVHSL